MGDLLPLLAAIIHRRRRRAHAAAAAAAIRRSAPALLREEEDEEAEHAAHDPLQHRAPLRDVARVDSRRRRLLPPSYSAAAEHNERGAAKERLGKMAGTGAEVARDGDSVRA